MVTSFIETGQCRVQYPQCHISRPGIQAEAQGGEEGSGYTYAAGLAGGVDAVSATKELQKKD